MTHEIPAPPEWAIVELMGHRRRAGRIFEVEKYGAKLLRLDIPVRGGEGATAEATPDAYVTEFYGGAAIYAVRPCAEDVARAAADSIGDPRPVVPVQYRVEHDSGFDDGGPYNEHGGV